MDEIVIDTEARATIQPGYGFWLGFLAVILMLNILSSIKGLIAVGISLQPVEGSSIDVPVDILVVGSCVTCLFFLLTRRRIFIPAMIALLTINLVVTVGLGGYTLATGSALEEPSILALTIILATVFNGLWIAYLLKSKRVREVCVR